MIKERNFPHDMGGEKAGPIPLSLKDFDQRDPIVFKEEWHARALAITVLSGAHGKWTLDESRHIRETLPEDDYRSLSYYEKWLSGLAGLLVRHGLVSRDELKAGDAAIQPLQEKTLRGDQVKSAMDKGSPSIRDIDQAPRFKIGDIVTTKSPEITAQVENGHTRLPRYAALKKGVVIAYYGGHILPDRNAHGLDDAADHLYAVQFKASDLWDESDDRDHVVVDCWESYLT